MAYTDRFYSSQPATRSDRSDLLKDAEDTFYGGGNAQPRATPTPTPSPKPAMLNGSQNAASRVTPSFLGQNGNSIGPMYDQNGNVNALPRGAAGAQGGQGAAAFDRSLNGASSGAFNLSLNPKSLDINNLIYPSSPTSPSRGPLLSRENVITPTMGAAKYMYVDPRATGVPSPTVAPPFNPMTHNPPGGGLNAIQDLNLYRTLGPNVNQPRALEIAKGQQGQDDRPEKSYPGLKQNTSGMLNVPTMDTDGPEASSTYEMDGKTYVLPTQLNGVKFDGNAAVERFRNTGEHLGVFNTEDDAQKFRREYLDYNGDSTR